MGETHDREADLITIYADLGKPCSTRTRAAWRKWQADAEAAGWRFGPYDPDYWSKALSDSEAELTVDRWAVNLKTLYQAEDLICAKPHADG